jgi:hypothetical protein
VRKADILIVVQKMRRILDGSQLIGPPRPVPGIAAVRHWSRFIADDVIETSWDVEECRLLGFDAVWVFWEFNC